MNVLVVANKKDARLYEAVVKAAPNTNLLGSIYSVGGKFLSQIKDRYHPHAVIFDTTVPHMKKNDLMQVLSDLNNTYPYIKLIVFTQDAAEAEFLKSFCFAVIDSPITNTEMADLLKKAEKSYGSYGQIYEKPDRAQVLSPDMLPYAFLGQPPPYNDNEYEPKKESNPDVKTKILKIILIVASLLLIGCLVLFGVMTLSERKSETTPVSTAATTVPSTAAATEDTAEPTEPTYAEESEASGDEASVTAAPITVSPTEKSTEESKLVISATVSADEVIKITPSTLTLNVDQSHILSAQDSTGNTLKWISSDDGVATVDQDGKVKAISGGTAYIVVSNGSDSDACLVTVNDKEG